MDRLILRLFRGILSLRHIILFVVMKKVFFDIDESNLYRRLGLYTKQFDWEKMWAIADNITDETAIDAKIKDIHNTFEVLGDYQESDIRTMARYVVAFEQWVKDEQIGLIASHYDGFAQGKAGVLDSMLIPAFSMQIKQGTACAVEGDITYLAITQDGDGNFKFVAAEGVNEKGKIFKFGDTNMRTRFSCGAREFVNRWSEAGPTHHMAARICI